MKVLIVEDDKELLELVTCSLRAEGYETDGLRDGEEGLYYAENGGYDIILLDRMLPSLDGTQILERLRKKQIMPPVMLVTALDGVGDRVFGLDLGADDYLIKPFEMEELLARMRAVLRRPGRLAEEKKVCFGDLSYQPREHLLCCGEKEKRLSPREGALILFFLQNPGQVLTREQILYRVWGMDVPVEDGNVDNYIYFLRRRLKGLDSRVKLETIHGIGYRMGDNHAT